jgi:hypothetical protein
LSECRRDKTNRQARRVADGTLLEQIEPLVTTGLIRFSDDETSLRLYYSSPCDTVRVYTQRLAQAAAE